jgi:hypothetical protein
MARHCQFLFYSKPGVEHFPVGVRVEGSDGKERVLWVKGERLSSAASAFWGLGHSAIVLAFFELGT